MSRYTVRGSAELDARIDADMRRIEEAASPLCTAGVLLGGYGRGEGTPFIHSDGSQAPFNDYDLIVVVDKLTAGLRQKLQALETLLSADLGLPVDLYPYRISHLRKCEFSLLNYEMKHGHMVVWGDENILDAMPDYPHDAIPLSEGTRLLMNRGKLLLDMKHRLANKEPLTDEERIRFIKFIYKALLAFGDCALLAEGKYDISYTVKKERIPTIGTLTDRDFVVDGYLRAIELKEWGDFQPLENVDVAAGFKTARDVFLRFFMWYESQRLETDFQSLEEYHRKLPMLGRECSALKAVLLNLRCAGRPIATHPRLRMYAALQELLKDEPDETLLGRILFCRDNFAAEFYNLQRRFS